METMSWKVIVLVHSNYQYVVYTYNIFLCVLQACSDTFSRCKEKLFDYEAPNLFLSV